jgi:hypothetical protein
MLPLVARDSVVGARRVPPRTNAIRGCGRGRQATGATLPAGGGAMPASYLGVMRSARFASGGSHPEVPDMREQGR